MIRAGVLPNPVLSHHSNEQPTVRLGITSGCNIQNIISVFGLFLAIMAEKKRDTMFCEAQPIICQHPSIE